MLQATGLHLPKFPKSLHSPSPIKHNNLQPKITSSIYSYDQKCNTKVLVEIQEKKQQSLLTTILYSLDDFISNFLDSPLPPSIDPHHLLSGNFAPVEELPPTACEVVEGSLPASLDGAYIRNGPNPHFFPRGPYHPFDGDGMLHSVTISGGRATFCSRYVKTYKFKTEAEIGRAFFPSPFSSCHGGLATAARFLLTAARGALGQFDPSANGFGTANTSLACFNGNLYALCESDLPYKIHLAEDGDVITLGRCDFGGGRGMTERMTAHPHSDPESGEVFAFKCNVFAPFLAFFKIDSGGKRGSDLAISSMKRMACVHDFGLTERFIVFQDVQIEMDPAEVVRGRTPLVCRREKVPRVGVLAREAADDGGLVWIETPGLNLLHVTNAWEGECGGRIVIVAPNFLAADRGFLDTNLMHSRFEMIELDINEKKVVSRYLLSGKNMEFGVINPAYAGKKNRYIYAAVIVEMPKAGGVVKIDLSKVGAEGSDCTVAMREFGEGCYGGEPYFVAREGAEEEDDGYLVTYVHKESSEESWFWVMDAKSPTLEIVARVRLPGRVPYGYHGLYVPKKHLKLL
ncbi:probable carotenoid cleavage dioxygenase 4, chloroplastic [Salvia hispanica]|uniref:probable carotenoid cleavage dioxygenase 4, chloroplastic n=1 Tax=Salvia hispanica TaxID=49212 RepID=UPI0020093946|nr:probable carotenoid cleavage dioxygenase 4, chloroplastic [Salvia hispanica]